MQVEEVLLYERAGAVATLTMNRPEKRNAQNLRMLELLSASVARASTDPDVRVIVLRGAGPCFSAGHDLHENAHDPEVSRLRSAVETRVDLERRLYWQPALDLRDVPKPTIAQVHGYCIAAGLMLAAMCDFVIASEDAVFSDPVVRMGAAGVELPVELWAFGPRRAKEILLTARAVDATTAFTWGFVNRVVARDGLESEVASLAASIAEMPPEAVRLTKLSINRSLDTMGMAASFEQHFDIHQVAHATEESRRLLEERREAGGVRKYVARRDHH